MMYTPEQVKEYAGLTALISDVETLQEVHKDQPQLMKELEDFNALVTVLEVAIALHKQKVPVTFLSIVQYLAASSARSELNHSGIMSNIEKKVGETLPVAIEHEYLVNLDDALDSNVLRITTAGLLLVGARKEATYKMRYTQESALRH